MSQTVPAEREVSCPKCGATKKTKASQNVRLRCPGCGAPFLAPAPAVPPVVSQATPKAAAAPVQPKASKPRGVAVVKASGVTVRSNAKVRKPAATSAEPADPKGPPSPAPPAPSKPPPDQERHKQAGRRGGLGFYQRRVRRAG